MIDCSPAPTSTRGRIGSQLPRRHAPALGLGARGSPPRRPFRQVHLTGGSMRGLGARAASTRSRRPLLSPAEEEFLSTPYEVGARSFTHPAPSCPFEIPIFASARTPVPIRARSTFVPRPLSKVAPLVKRKALQSARRARAQWLDRARDGLWNDRPATDGTLARRAHLSPQNRAPLTRRHVMFP